MLAMLLLHTPAHADTLARCVETQLTRQHLPGLALMVLKNGKRVESRSFSWTEAPLNDGRGSGYGMGWFVDTMRGRALLEHSGGTPGFTTQVLRLPQDRLTVIVLGNSYNSYAVTDVAGHLARLHLPALRYKPT